MMKKIEPSEIGKNPDLIASELRCLQFWLFWFIHVAHFPSPRFYVILEAQKEMAQSDIHVCGKCHSVFHFIDLFKEHKANNCKRISAFNDCVSSTEWGPHLGFNFLAHFSGKRGRKSGLISCGSRLSSNKGRKMRRTTHGSYTKLGCSLRRAPDSRG